LPLLSLHIFIIIKFINEWCQTPEAVDVLNYLNLTAASLGNHEPLGVVSTTYRGGVLWDDPTGRFVGDRCIFWSISVAVVRANPWQIHGKSCSLSTASAYFWCTYPLVNVDITTGYGKSPFFRGKLTISMATVLSTGDPTGFFAGLIPRAFHL